MKLIIADDMEIVREGFRLSIESAAPDIRVAACCGSIDDAVAFLENADGVDLALLDLKMPGMEFFAGIERVKAAGANRVAILSGVSNEVITKVCIDRGASGFLPKTMNAAALVAAIRLINSGETYLPVKIPGDHAGWIDDLAQDAEAGLDAERESLTIRERDVMRLVIDGLSNKEIARSLGLTEATVKVHVKHIFRKFGVSRRAQLVRRALGQQ